MASSALKALLGVLAVAGFQNRDKIGELLRGVQQPQGDRTPGQQSGGLGGLLGGLTGGSAGGLGGLGGLLGGASGGSVLGGGLGDLLKQFQQNGHGETAKSWVELDRTTKLTIPSYHRHGPESLTICLHERVCRPRKFSAA